MCSITQEVFEDPVVLVDTGHSYERAALEAWLRRKRSCPLSGRPVSGRVVVNWTLRDAVAGVRAQRGLPQLPPPRAHAPPLSLSARAAAFASSPAAAVVFAGGAAFAAASGTLALALPGWVLRAAWARLSCAAHLIAMINMTLPLVAACHGWMGRRRPLATLGRGLRNRLARGGPRVFTVYADNNVVVLRG